MQEQLSKLTALQVMAKLLKASQVLVYWSSLAAVGDLSFQSEHLMPDDGYTRAFQGKHAAPIPDIRAICTKTKTEDHND